MPATTVRAIPRYCGPHASGQAYVIIKRKRVYLGKHNTPESLQAYDRVIGEWIANGGCRPTNAAKRDSCTVQQLAARWLAWFEDYHEGSTKVYSAKATAKVLVDEYGQLPVEDFRPRCLMRLQDLLVERDLSRGYINETVQRVRQIFRWGVARELVPPDLHAALQAVDNLRKGKTKARETDDVKPVSDFVVGITLGYVSRTVRDLALFQRLTGCRPGEAASVRPCDVDTRGDIWFYRPAKHKTAHRGKARAIAIGPQAQKVLRPYLLRPAEAYCFSPKQDGSKQYNRCGVALAIARAAEQAGMPHWTPNQLRHTAGTAVRQQFGLEAAQVALGHSRADVTQVYAESSEALAAEVARAIG